MKKFLFFKKICFCLFIFIYLFLTIFSCYFQQVLRRITKRQLAILSQDPKAEWSGIDPKDESELPNLENEDCVAGIYLRLLVANPGWVLRKPKETVGELVEASLQALQKEEVNYGLLKYVFMPMLKYVLCPTF
jgi:hypothetical protein